MSTEDHTTLVQYRGVPGWPGYRVGDDGSVWGSRHRNGQPLPPGSWRKLAPSLNSGGYPAVALRNREKGLVRTIALHALVLTAFRGPRPAGYQACHFPDPAKTNNNLSNLRWDTIQANQDDILKAGNRPYGERHHNAKVTAADVAEMRRLYHQGVYARDIAVRFGISSGSVHPIVNGKIWKSVPMYDNENRVRISRKTGEPVMPRPPRKPRTPAQQFADYKKTFPRKVNQRRLELIEKEFGPRDPGRDGWRFDEHPGWHEECELRRRANLTDEERAELAECERIVDEWQEKSPWAASQRGMMDEMEERLARLLESKKAEFRHRIEALS